MADALMAPGDVERFHALHLGTVDDVLQEMAVFGEAPPTEEEDWPVPEPVRNALRDVGRNDPCPCGSGKKYKKCCLNAAV